jgi:predicted ATPase
MLTDLFTELQVSGFRRLADVKVSLRGLQLLIGANGAGKTTLLQTWELLRGAASGKLSDFIRSLGGFPTIQTIGGGDELRVRLTYRRPPLGDFVYDLGLKAKLAGYEVAAESLIQFQGSGSATHLERHGLRFDYADWDDNRQATTRTSAEHEHLSPTETAFNAAPRLDQSTRTIRDALRSVELYRPIPFGPRAAVVLPQQADAVWLPGPDGETLTSSLHHLRETDSDRFEMVEDTLRAAFPGFEALSFPAVGGGMLSLRWKEKDRRRPFSIYELSEGTVRFLWLTALLASPKLPPVVLIDEPEVSLHPALLQLLLELMREAAGRSQLIVATQSDRLVRFAEPEEVLVADVEEGAARFTPGDHFDLKHWLADYSLDQVWDMGVIGGQPPW